MTVKAIRLLSLMSEIVDAHGPQRTVACSSLNLPVAPSDSWKRAMAYSSGVQGHLTLLRGVARKEHMLQFTPAQT